MPTEIARSSAPSARRAGKPGMSSRDVAPLSITALAIIAILVVVLHVAGGDLLSRSQAHASVAAPDDEAKCPAEVTPAAASLPFD
jgi:hypothetical protein